MSELGPKTRSLLQRAAGGYEPSQGDQARVRAGIARKLAATAVAAGAGAVASKTAAASIAPAPIAASVAPSIAPAPIAAAIGGAASGAGAGAAIAGGTSIAVKIAVPLLLAGSVGAGAVTLASRAHAPDAAVARAPSAVVARAASSGAEGARVQGAPTRPVLPNGVVLPEVPRDGDPRGELGEPSGAAPALLGPTANAATPPAVIEHRPPAPSRAPVGKAPAAGDERGTLAEVALMRDAQVALRAGNAPRALRLVDEHAQRYPFGALAEEREALRVFALCDLGRTAEAGAEATIFLSAHPQSPIADRVRSSCNAKKDP